MMFTSFTRFRKFCSAFMHHPTRVVKYTPASSISHRYMSTPSQPQLEFDVGPYRAAEVRASTLTQSTDEEFLRKLKQSIGCWKQNNFTSAWVSVPSSRARLIESLTDHNFGFDLHHTNSTLQTITLKKWLLNSEDLIPPFATHQVGCAGFVLNDNNEILLIKEWSGPRSPAGGKRIPSKQWKLPGGLLDAGESLEVATVREVFEETGIQCNFEGILSFWHRHGLKYGKSDLYYVCLLKPTTEELNICPVEVSDAIWMHVDDFLEKEDHPLITHVLKQSFRLDGVGKIRDINEERLKPHAKMVTGAVQWPGRSPYPTYTSVVTER